MIERLKYLSSALNGNRIIVVSTIEVSCVKFLGKFQEKVVVEKWAHVHYVCSGWKNNGES